MGEVPGVAAGEFESKQDLVAGVEEVWAEVFVAFDESAEPAATFFGLGWTEGGRRETDEMLETANTAAGISARIGSLVS